MSIRRLATTISALILLAADCSRISAAADGKQEKEISVRAGSTVTVQMKKAVARVSNEDESIAQVRSIPGNAEALYLTGMTEGTTRMTLTDTEGKEESYQIVVEPRRVKLAERLRPGFLAFGVKLAPEDAVGGSLGYKDYVTVFAARKESREGKQSGVLMKNIRVLAVNSQAASQNPREQGGSVTVILEVTPEEAQRLKKAQGEGALALGLLSNTDAADEKALKDRRGDEDK